MEKEWRQRKREQLTTFWAYCDKIQQLVYSFLRRQIKARGCYFMDMSAVFVPKDQSKTSTVNKALFKINVHKFSEANGGSWQELFPNRNCAYRTYIACVFWPTDACMFSCSWTPERFAFFPRQSRGKLVEASHRHPAKRAGNLRSVERRRARCAS